MFGKKDRWYIIQEKVKKLKERANSFRHGCIFFFDLYTEGIELALKLIDVSIEELEVKLETLRRNIMFDTVHRRCNEDYKLKRINQIKEKLNVLKENYNRILFDYLPVLK